MLYNKVMRYRRNSDEEVRNLERQVLTGDESALDHYILTMHRMGQMHTPIGSTGERRQQIIENDLATAHLLFNIQLAEQSGPELVLEFCRLDPPERFIAAALIVVNPEFAARYINDPYAEIRSKRGKFDTVLDSLVYQLDSEDSYSNEGWGNNAQLYTLSSEDLSYLNELSIEATGAPLTAGEMEEILRAEGAILYEDSQGSVTVNFFPSRAELRRAWEELAEDFPSDDPEEAEEAEDDSDGETE
jgi:hypothetical protein